MHYSLYTRLNLKWMEPFLNEQTNKNHKNKTNKSNYKMRKRVNFVWCIRSFPPVIKKALLHLLQHAFPLFFFFFKSFHLFFLNFPPMLFKNTVLTVQIQSAPVHKIYKPQKRCNHIQGKKKKKQQRWKRQQQQKKTVAGSEGCKWGGRCREELWSVCMHVCEEVHSGGVKSSLLG